MKLENIGRANRLLQKRIDLLSMREYFSSSGNNAVTLSSEESGKVHFRNDEHGPAVLSFLTAVVATVDTELAALGVEIPEAEEGHED